MQDPDDHSGALDDFQDRIPYDNFAAHPSQLLQQASNVIEMTANIFTRSQQSQKRHPRSIRLKSLLRRLLRSPRLNIAQSRRRLPRHELLAYHSVSIIANDYSRPNSLRKRPRRLREQKSGRSAQLTPKYVIFYCFTRP